nr:MAG TPA: Rho termination factor, N-terminal domain [Caudoviricetes sp.]
MVFDHKVKYKGKWYLPGEEIEEEKEEAEESASLPFEKTFTKTEINRMSTEALKSLAAENNVPGYEEMTGASLKEYFINLLNL